MKTIKLIALLVFTSSLCAQFKPLPPSQIPDSLKRGADAVVQESIEEVEILSTGMMHREIRKWVTVFNQEGREAIRMIAYYDPGVKIKNLEAEIFNAAGSSIKKYKSKDFEDFAAVSGISLYEDSRVKYLHYVPQSFPYTVYFSYKEESGNTAFLPRWYPIEQYGVSVMSSQMELRYPMSLKPRFKEWNLEKFGVEKEVGPEKSSFRFPPRAALKREALSGPIYEVGPTVWPALNKFRLENVNGEGADWESFGRWQYEELIKGRDALPQSTISEVTLLLKGITDPKEKAKRIYEYVQENTRYISVQLGIGGWMPISAEEVDRVKYGDCKGLTNYTKALLSSQGIESNYAVVWAGSQKRDMVSDFASMQGNHAILNVPIDGEDIWLECTSQTLPFNYLGDFTDDRLVLMVTPDGGEIKRTHQYLDDDNTTNSEVAFSISPEGNFAGSYKAVHGGIAYDHNYTWAKEKEKDIKEHYKERWSDLTDISIDGYQFTNNTDEVLFEESVDLQARNYAQFVGQEMLFRLNPLDQNTYVPKRVRNRETEFSIARGYTDRVVSVVQLPEGYSLENIPEPVLLLSKFGSYTSKVKRLEDGKLQYERTFSLKHGKYPAEDYETYRKFRRKVAGHDRARVAAQRI